MYIDLEDIENMDCPDGYEPDEYEFENDSGTFDEPQEMTDEDAFGIFDLAIALGLGEEIGLSEAETMRSIEKESQAKYESMSIADDLVELDSESNKKKDEPKSLKTRKLNDEYFSSVTGKLKCPFEQWIKDVVAGRKTIHDPVGGINSYGKSKY